MINIFFFINEANLLHLLVKLRQLVHCNTKYLQPLIPYVKLQINDNGVKSQKISKHTYKSNEQKKISIWHYILFRYTVRGKSQSTLIVTACRDDKEVASIFASNLHSKSQLQDMYGSDSIIVSTHCVLFE